MKKLKLFWSDIGMTLQERLILIMKLTVIFTLVLTLSSFGAIRGQVISYSGKNVKMSDFFRAIKKQVDYDVISKTADIQDMRLTLNFKEESLRKVLDVVFAQHDLEYIIDNKAIVVRKGTSSKKGVSEKIVKTDVALQQLVKGRLLDALGNAVVGATISIKGKTSSAQTDQTGAFSINAALGDELIFSSVGFQSTKHVVRDLKPLVIKVEENILDVDEVVVVGYGTQKKENLTGAVSTVTSETLDSRTLGNVGQGLQGLIPNLNITADGGRPGTGSSFNIRGFTSVNGGSPLVLVDGVQIDPNQINPDDVASVTVLKDAASAAIYGGRAAYGVILITTKNGKFGSPLKISYNFNQSFARPTRLPNYINSLDYVTMYLEADRTGSQTGGNTGGMGFTDLDVEKIKKYLENPIPENSVYHDPNDPSRYRYVGNTDWMEEMYPGWQPINQHDVNFSGGGENYNFYSSFAAYREKGLVKEANQKFGRYNGNIGVNMRPSDWLELSTKIRLNRKENDQPANTSVHGIMADGFPSGYLPTMPVRHPDGNWAGQTSFTNQFALINESGRSTYNEDDIWITGGITLKPIKNFQVVGDITWNSFRHNDKYNTKSFMEYGAVPIGEDMTDPTKAVPVGMYPHNLPAFVGERNTHDIYSAINLYAQYENVFVDKHYLKLMAGYNQEYKKNESFHASVKDLLNQDYPFLKLNNDVKPSVGSAIGEWALAGQFFRVNYIYDERYLLEVNGRYDGSSRFAAKDRYVFSPSVSLAWRLSKESFMDFLKPLVNDLKIRGSYGVLPNQWLENQLYPYIATMPYGQTGYLFGNDRQTYISSPNLVSSNFSWEEVTSRNLGVDFALLNNRLTGSFDIYNRDTKGMIVAGLSLPAILGVSSPNRNAADLRTKGFEIELNWKDKLDNGLSYFVGFNLGDNRAKITKYDLNPTGDVTGYYVGKDIGEIWGYVSNGLYQSDADAAVMDKSKLWGGEWLAGDVKFEDLNQDGVIDFGNNTLSNPGDRKVIGNDQARYSFGLRGGLEYKGFDFTVFLQGVAKRDAALGGPYFWGFTSEWAIPTEEHLDYYTAENTGGYFPRQRFGGGGNFQTSSRYLQDASYLRLKQLTVGYTLSSQLLSKIKLQKVRVFATGQNLFEFTNLIKSYDPEQFDRLKYPLNRTIALGVQLSY